MCSSFVPCFVVQYFVSNHLDRNEKAVCLQVSCGCYCSVALPHGAVGWSAVCECGIF